MVAALYAFALVSFACFESKAMSFAGFKITDWHLFPRGLEVYDVKKINPCENFGFSLLLLGNFDT